MDEEETKINATAKIIHEWFSAEEELGLLSMALLWEFPYGDATAGNNENYYVGVDPDHLRRVNH